MVVGRGMVFPPLADSGHLHVQEAPELLDLGGDVPHAHRVGDCLCGLAVSSGEAVYSENIHDDARCTWQDCKQVGITSFAAIPLVNRDEVIGTLGIASARRRGSPR